MLAGAALLAAFAFAAAKPAVLVAAGDIASCDSRGDEATAAVVVRIPGTVAALGDTVYERGTATEYGRCYAPSWGRFKRRTRPAVGNHEYLTPGAADYFAYFGRAAGDPSRGYYSYELGAWHIVVLNSNCGPAGGCGAGSPQERWLRADLAAHVSRCTLAYWHHPRFSSGLHGPAITVAALWRALADAGAELVVSGHDHDYERFAPQDANGRLDRKRGIRQFVVGTGGRSLRPTVRKAPNSVIRQSQAYGVLKLTLFADRYLFRFVAVRGASFRDSGSARCR